MSMDDDPFLAGARQQAQDDSDKRLAVWLGQHSHTGGQWVFAAAPGVRPIWGQGEDVLWAMGQPLMVAGNIGAGKTTVAGQLVLGRIGIINEVLGSPITGGGRVLDIVADRPEQIRQSLRRQVRDEDREELDLALTVVHGPLYDDLARCPELLLVLAEQTDVDTVVLDSLKDVALKLSDDEVGAAVNKSWQLCVANGVEVLVLHHPKKPVSGQGPPSIDQIYGSTWLTAGCGSVLLLSGAAGDSIVRMHHLKPPASEVGPLDLLHQHDTGHTEVYKPTSVDPMRLVTFCGTKGLLVADLARALFSGDKDPTHNQVEKARRRLEKLYADGKVVRKAEGTEGPNTRWRYIAREHWTEPG